MAQSAPDRDIGTIRASRTLRVAITRFKLPAFHWRDGANFVGPEIDLANQIGSALGVEVVFVDDPSSFDAVVDTVASGKADIGISKLSQTYYRMLRVRFSAPYIVLRHALLYDRATLANAASGHALDDALRHFSGRVAVISNSAYADTARRNFPTAQVVSFPNWDGVIKALVAGSVDAVYRDEFEIKRVLKLNPAMNVRFGTAVISDQLALLSVAVCDTCGKLQELINYHLSQTTGTFSLPALLASQLKD